ncbi:hypothetical protein ACFVFS_23945 [Kitasatospora sp. NPDC057692]|uniref:hypothetical protein n=1 Tax=Kitasatospora sp. NPDC057692 TaxID=3346215 RepID=UPI0036AC22A6
MTQTLIGAGATAQLQPGYITTVAGGGSEKRSEGVQAVKTSLKNVSAVASDGRTNLYLGEREGPIYQPLVSRMEDEKIYTFTSTGLETVGGLLWSGPTLYISDHARVWAAKPPDTGLTPVAGTGQAGFDGDGKPATETAIGNPVGLAVDHEGNLYIADYGNHRVRKVLANGNHIVHTIAGDGTASGKVQEGGDALAAGLMDPAGVVVGGTGIVYISDAGIDRVFAVTPDGKIRTVAGGGTKEVPADGSKIKATDAHLKATFGLVMGPSGDIFLSDPSQNRVFRLHVAEGALSLVAGNGTNTDSGDGGKALDAGVPGPDDLAMDASGNLYIAEYAYHRVRMVAAVDRPSGVVTLESAVGDNLSAQTGTIFAPALAVIAKDNSHNPVPGVQVTFTIQKDDPTHSTFPGGTECTALTQADGKATAADLTAGPTAGQFHVQASTTGNVSFRFTLHVTQ